MMHKQNDNFLVFLTLLYSATILPFLCAAVIWKKKQPKNQRMFLISWLIQTNKFAFSMCFIFQSIYKTKPA